MGEGYHLFVVGGRFWDFQSNEFSYLNTTWRYDAITRVWTPLPDLEVPTGKDNFNFTFELHYDVLKWSFVPSFSGWLFVGS